MNAEADRQFRAGRYPAALALYEDAAAGGDAHASEMAGYMLYFGPALFGPGTTCDRHRARCLLGFAAEAGLPVAQMLMRQLARSEQAASSRHHPNPNEDISCKPGP